MLTANDQVSLQRFLQIKAKIFHNALFFLKRDIARCSEKEQYKELIMYANRAYIYDTLLQVLHELAALKHYNELLNYEQLLTLQLKDSMALIHAETLINQYKLIVRTTQEVQSNVTYVA